MIQRTHINHVAALALRLVHSHGGKAPDKKREHLLIRKRKRARESRRKREVRKGEKKERKKTRRRKRKKKKGNRKRELFSPGPELGSKGITCNNEGPNIIAQRGNA